MEESPSRRRRKQKNSEKLGGTPPRTKKSTLATESASPARRRNSNFATSQKASGSDCDDNDSVLDYSNVRQSPIHQSVSDGQLMFTDAGHLSNTEDESLDSNASGFDSPSGHDYSQKYFTKKHAIDKCILQHGSHDFQPHRVLGGGRCFFCGKSGKKGFIGGRALIKCSRCKVLLHRPCLAEFSALPLASEMPVHLDEQTLEALGAQLFQHIETGNAEELQQMPHLRQLLRHQYTVDKITPLIKCINKYSTKPDPAVAQCFAVMLEKADERALNLQDGKARWTPLMWALAESYASTELLDQLTKRPNIDVSRALAVMCAKYIRADFKLYFEFLCKRGADVNEAATHDNTPLHKACQNHSIGAMLVRALLSKQADFELINERGQTPLFEAVRHDQEDIVKTLLTAGADCMAQDEKRKKPSHYVQSVAVGKLLEEAEDRFQQLQDWLRSLNLERYAENFAHQGVFLDRVHLLDDRSMIDIGVNRVGDRLQLREAVRVRLKSRKPNPSVEQPQVDNDNNMVPQRRKPRLKRSKPPAARTVPPGAAPASNDNTANTSTAPFDGEIEYKSIQFQEELGRGTFGTVYRGQIRNLVNGTMVVKPVAIKIIEPNDTTPRVLQQEQLVKQYRLWSTLEDPHIVSLYGICLKPQLSIITEICSRGNLLSLMHQSTLNLHWQTCLTWSMQIVAAVFYLVSGDPAIYHRDLKPANVLVTQAWTLKLCDFDTARFSDASSRSLAAIVGSPAYLAPELYNETPYSEASDVYALGIMLNELVTRCIEGQHEAPFAGFDLPPLALAAFIAAAQNKKRPRISKKTPSIIVDLVEKAWAPDVKDRPSCETLLEMLRKSAEQYIANREEWDALRNLSFLSTTPRGNNAHGSTKE